mgnify:CR=1 FL=1
MQNIKLNYFNTFMITMIILSILSILSIIIKVYYYFKKVEEFNNFTVTGKYVNFIQ